MDWCAVIKDPHLSAYVGETGLHRSQDGRFL